MERITRIELTGFRGIREGAIDGLVDVNVFVGRNNSGKSTIVEAILRTAEAFSDGASDVAHRMRGVRLHALRLETESVQNLRHADAASTRVEIDASDAPTTRSWQFGKNQGPSRSDGNAFFATASCFWPSDAHDSNIERTLWNATLRARRDKVLARSLSAIFGMDVESIQLPPDGRAMLLFPTRGLPLDAQGDGARAAFRALTMLGAMNGSVFILEEPECHQHPGSLRRFAQAVVSLARENDVQLVLTTHSAECVAAFLEASLDAGSESAVFHLALAEGHLDVRKLDAATVTTLSDSGTDVRYLSLYA